MAPVRPQGRPCVALPAARGREDGSVIHPIQGAYVQAGSTSPQAAAFPFRRPPPAAAAYMHIYKNLSALPVDPIRRGLLAALEATGAQSSRSRHHAHSPPLLVVPISNEDGERSIGRSAVGAGSYRDSRRKKKEQEEQWVMLILELGIWVLPFTLLLAPARRMVRLVAELQRIFLAVACRRAPPPTLGEVWSRLDRLDSAIVVP
ncbi:hypothetical protein SETIT_4G029700v2 [Setaria italica]|uniref:Uncharacterized protein n=1 Tax=Setaria italica TaxID=4555 RepID=A0A368QS55_SETIT|nr:uncharacterized protein LOC101784438 [Setaria italica]RCV20110.1 hypothetical protein SETIT_4G029700v2 [Setaria italica]